MGEVNCRSFISIFDERTDITCKLLEIDKEDNKRIIAEGINRLNISADSTERISIDSDKILECQVDLWDIAHKFTEGHKIGLEISWSNFPNWDLNSLEGETIKLYMDRKYPSSLCLQEKSLE